MFKFVDGKLIMSQGNHDYYVTEYPAGIWNKIMIEPDDIKNNKVENSIGSWIKCYENEVEKIEEFILSLPKNKKLSKIVDEIIGDWFGPSGKTVCKKHKCKDCPECQPLGRQENRKFRYIQENDYNIGQ